MIKNNINLMKYIKYSIIWSILRFLDLKIELKSDIRFLLNFLIDLHENRYKCAFIILLIVFIQKIYKIEI
jgi:hypothetical protein